MWGPSQEFYKEKLADQKEFHERFCVLGEREGISRRKVLSKLEAEKAWQLPLCQEVFCIFQVVEVPCDFSFVDAPNSGKIEADFASPLENNSCARILVSCYVWFEAEEAQGKNNFEFLLGYLASFAADLPTYKEIVVPLSCLSCIDFLLHSSVGYFLLAIVGSMPGSAAQAER